MDIAILVVDGVADFSLAALLDVLGVANVLREELDPPPMPWHVGTVSLGERVRTGQGHIVPTLPFPDTPEELGRIIVPAVSVIRPEGIVEMVSSPPMQPVLDRIRRAYDNGAHLAAACTGTFFLAEAGVLDGSTATTSWWLGPTFRQRYPRVDLDEKQPLCQGDHVTTAAASLFQLDLALSLLNDRSPALAQLVARYLTIGNRQTQANFLLPDVVARSNPLIAEFERWVRAHLAEHFRISSVASELGLTERTLQRATHAELGMSPKDFVDDIRLEHAAQLLRTTSLTIDAVANRVGYLSSNPLRELARRRRGMSIAEMRVTGLPVLTSWNS
ncbi:helix-turn-helix domain-containing protein [Nocardia sp. NBC_00508]|uniref:GlxA family transcriptional regulator n=1 Tax=Nocardia sp. NBC_00508 TaxID=2975992 RepID=UPI002E7FC47B|nr:helix-turn-helix domain-containing protein [Nocardia sp. NBC_00508]WUD65976.1 helix-turn-helix domain-containing protein [Nocardia sp. NBC_00508]